MLSPVTPVSLTGTRVGTEGADGATVSTEKLKGTRLSERGDVSTPVRVCCPSLSGIVSRMQTLPSASLVNEPIGAPSMNIWKTPSTSPPMTNDGVALLLAVGSDPMFSVWPHEPSSSPGAFSDQERTESPAADAEPTADSVPRHATATTAARQKRRRFNMAGPSKGSQSVRGRG